MTKALIYCRVSSQRQVDEGHGLDGQEKRCRDYAKSKGYEVIEVFRDAGVSGGLIDRAGMQTLLRGLENYRNDSEQSVVIFDDIKRLARDVVGHFELKKAIYTRNARVESPSHRFEDTPSGKFIETMLAAHGELERNENRIQVINRMRARLESGYWPFCMPLGLINRKDSIHGKILVSREPYATIYTEGIEKFRDGIIPTIDAFQIFCNEKYKELGINHIMSHSTATATLKEILYAGYIEYPKWNIPLVKAKHEGFISLETYNAVQQRLQGRTRPWKRRDYSADFPLRPHVLCAACGKSLTASWNTGRSARYPNYFCRGKDCIYRWKVVGKHKLESEFESLLSTVKPADEVLDLTKDVLQEQWSLRFETYTESRHQAKKEVDELTTSIVAFTQRVGKTKDEELIAVYEKEIKELGAKKKLVEQNLNKQHYTSEEFGTASEKVFNTLKNPVSMWKSDDYNDKRTIIGMYFEENLKYDYKKGFGTATLAYPVALITKNPASGGASVEMSGSEPESEKAELQHLQA